MVFDFGVGKEVGLWEFFSCVGVGGLGCEGMIFRCCFGI